MTRQRLFRVFVWLLSAFALSLLLLSAGSELPSTLGKDPRNLLINGAILLALTFLSTISPMETVVGTVTVSLAPQFGAILVLPPWAVMLVAALGTIDSRVPGKGMPWHAFFFNRAMYVVTCGVPSLALYLLGIRAGEAGWYVALPLVVVATVGLNISQVAVYFSLLRGTNLLVTAQRMLAGRWATYIGLPLVGYLIWALMGHNSFPGFRVVCLLYGPLLVYRASLQTSNRPDKRPPASFTMHLRAADKRAGPTFGTHQRSGAL